MNKPYRHGAVVGKFMPLHEGHAHLIRFACEMCERVTVVVDCVPGEWPSADIRAEALRGEFADLRVNIVALPEPTPQEPSDHPEFWSIWRNLMLNACGDTPDALVCAMDYGRPLSRVMGCDFVPLDIGREAIPLCATDIRADIWGMWDRIMPRMRVHYLTRVALEGAESTGKSTAARELAESFGWSYAPEWAECFINSSAADGREFCESDLLLIGKGHTAALKSLELRANKVLIMDSSLLTTITWSEFLYGRVHPELERMFEEEATRDIKRWIFTPETPWVHATHRDVDPNASDIRSRIRFHDILLRNVQKYELEHTLVSGDFSDKREFVNALAMEITAPPAFPYQSDSRFLSKNN